MAGPMVAGSSYHGASLPGNHSPLPLRLRKANVIFSLQHRRSKAQSSDGVANNAAVGEWMMYGLLALAVSVGAIALLGAKLLVVLGVVVAVATFAFPLGLILLVGAGVALTCHNGHRAIHWGRPD